MLCEDGHLIERAFSASERDVGQKSCCRKFRRIGNDKPLAVAIWKQPDATDSSVISILVAGPRRFQC
jgi:hypothetical protein